MTWKITGADINTGKDRECEVMAVSESEAMEMAKSQGILTASIEIGRVLSHPPVPVPPQPDSQADAGLVDTPSLDDVPKYDGLNRVASILLVFAILSAVCGLLACFLGMADRHPEVVVSGIGAMLSGLMMWGASQAADALRDMARNSWVMSATLTRMYVAIERQADRK